MAKTTALFVLTLVLLAAGCVQNAPAPAETTTAESTSLAAPETTTVAETTIETTVKQETTAAATTTHAETPTTLPTTLPQASTLPSTTTSTAQATSTTLPYQEVVVKKDGDYQATMKYAGLDGKTHTTRLDSGPFEQGDEFLLAGKVYVYSSYEITEDNTLEVELKDATSFSRQKIVLTPYTGGPIKLSTLAFTDSQSNDEEITLDPDTDPADTAVYSGTILGVPVLADESTLYLGVDANTKKTVGLNPDVTGTTAFTDIQMSSRGIGVLLDAEKGVNKNGAKADDVTDDDTDDVFIVIQDPGFSGTRKIYVDFYDRNYLKKDLTNSVKVASSLSTSQSIGSTFFDMDTPKETLIENFPSIAYKYNITYGSGNEITQVRAHT